MNSCLTGKDGERLPGCFKQSIVNHGRLMQYNGIEFMRQREHQVKISAGQKICLPLLYPLFPFISLALWAVAITPTVITTADIAAAITRIYMSAQGCCATVFKGT